MSIQKMINIYVSKLHLLLTLEEAGYKNVNDYLNYIYAQKLIDKYKDNICPELTNAEWLILGEILRDMSSETKT